MSHNVEQLEARIKALQADLVELAKERDLLELIRIIRQPGWTTPAEFTFSQGIVNSMNAHVKMIGELKEVLMSGARAVALG